MVRPADLLALARRGGLPPALHGLAVRLGGNSPARVRLAAGPGGVLLAFLGILHVLVPIAPAAAQSSSCRDVPEAESGWSAYTAGRLDEARARFEAALARCPNHAYARTGLAYVELREGSEERASALWSAVVESDPTNVDALVGLGLVAWRRGDLEAVRARFARVVELDPGHPTAVEYLERLRAGEAASSPDDPADAAWVEGDVVQAAALYRERLARNPGDAVAALRLALAHGWDGRYDEALALLDALLDRQPGRHDARVARARVLAWAGRLDDARAEIGRVLAVRPDDREALEARATFEAWARGRAEATVPDPDAITVTSIGELPPAPVPRAPGRGGSPTPYDSLLARDPDDVGALLAAARALALEGAYDEAIAGYDLVLARRPDHSAALLGRATTQGWSGDAIGGERFARRAVDLDARNAAAWAVLSRLLRWQGRTGAALEALDQAARLAPTDPEIQDALRAASLPAAPDVRPSVAHETDSDGNRMVTTALTAGWRPVPRLSLRASGYRRDLRHDRSVLGPMERTAFGGSLSGTYELDPGWAVTATLGGSGTNGTGDPAALAYGLSLRSPERHRLRAEVSVASAGLDYTAALAERGIRSSEVVLAARWLPAPAWLVGANVGVGRYHGSEDNGRRSAYLSVSRRLGGSFSLGTAARAFSFEKDLGDGYFDPDFYGIWELTGYWLHRPGPWTLLVELAPGVQQVTRDGEPGASLRSRLRVAYGVAPGREVSLTFGYSSAGLASFATRASDYRYTSLVLGIDWGFP